MRRSILFVSMFLMLSIYLSLSLGTVKVGLDDIIKGSPVFWSVRLPRTLVAFMVGASLSISGSVLQALFRNPLAEPYLLGISSGAGLGVCLSLLLGASWGLELSSFLGALFAVFLVYIIAARDGFLSIEGLLLTGVAVNAFFSALIGFLMYALGRDIHGLLFWMWGGFGLSSWDKVIRAFPLFLFSVLIIFRNSNELNVLLWGEEHASQMGVEVEKVKREVLMSSSLITAVSVSLSGMIGFVGLVIPHIVRITLSPDHRVLLPLSTLMGGGALMLADTLSRVLVPPGEIPVGFITALTGAPLFIYLLRRWRRNSA